MPMDRQTVVVVPIFEKGDWRVSSNYRGITLISFSGKVYARVLERKVHSFVNSLIQEEQCGFHPRPRTYNQLFIIVRSYVGVCTTNLHVFSGKGI